MLDVFEISSFYLFGFLLDCLIVPTASIPSPQTQQVSRSYICERIMLRQTHLISAAFRRVFSFYFPTASYQAYHVSHIEMIDFENSTENIISEKTLGGSIIFFFFFFSKIRLQ